MQPTLDAHRSRLRSAFLDWLVELGAENVLDLGAGRGELVEALGARGIDAEGIEADPDRHATATALGRSVAMGSAYRVARPDASVGWVTLRHVLHHLERPEAALQEALRLAREGVLIAEPISLAGVAMHDANARLERALRALDRARGAVHGPDLSPERIAALLPDTAEVEIRIHALLTPLPADEIEALVRVSSAGVDIGPEQRADIDAALAAAARGAIAPSGSAMIAARLVGR
ncbi:MAG: methyltransferase domain-containing protein [Planctomycetota bacterium]